MGLNGLSSIVVVYVGMGIKRKILNRYLEKKDVIEKMKKMSTTQRIRFAKDVEKACEKVKDIIERIK